LRKYYQNNLIQGNPIKMDGVLSANVHELQ